MTKNGPPRKTSKISLKILAPQNPGPVASLQRPGKNFRFLAPTPNLEALMAPLVQPRTLKGFRDYPPALMVPRERLLETARTVFRSYGFAPIDTPALEYTEVLLAKVEEGAEVKKQMFRFDDQGGRDVALRFDLTVPLARFVSQHVNDLGLPFKRYHMAAVWRGESPQVGRYREFMQCDFDTIGSLSPAADIEIALVIHDLLRALGIERFSVRVNDRRVLNGLLAELELPRWPHQFCARSTSFQRLGLMR
jgi:histidyl-tRNA synthetase